MVILHIVLSIIFFTSVSVEIEDKHFDVFGFSIASCVHVGEHIQFSGEVPIFSSNQHTELNVYGRNITPNLLVGFTEETSCNDVSPINFVVDETSDNHVAFVTFTTPDPHKGLFSQTRYYICTRYEGGEWTNLGLIGFYVNEPLFTEEILIIILLLAYSMSSLMSGLNIGLLSLDPHELELLKSAGSAKEKKYAAKILPVRRSGNFLLCSILITATLCNAISTVTVSRFVSELVAVVITTCVIVLLCEILPQSICTSYPLFVGANTIYITRACMLLTAPISFPLGKLLDWLLGKESLLVTYNKERLKELLALTHLEKHEAKIIAGTLNLSYKTVDEIMTMSHDMFKLPITAILDFETIATILASGYSRIPIYVGSCSNIQYILLTKDLALLDPDDKVPVKVLVQNVKLKCHYVSKGTTVDRLLEIFKDSRNHMVFVVEYRTSLSKEGDPLPKDRDSHPKEGSSREETNLDGEKNVIGLVTFEDVIEEILQLEINDETDNFTDNRNRNTISKLDSDRDLARILNKPSKAAKPSANFKSAIFNFLSDVDMFSKHVISPRVLQSLLNMDIYFTAIGQKLPQDTIYVQGVPANYFVMVLEGEMEVKIGSEGLTFEVGAFRYFGLEALKPDGIFIPDYMLQAVKKTTYIKIDKVIYEAALLATQHERTKQAPAISGNTDLYKYYKQLTD